MLLLCASYNTMHMQNHGIFVKLYQLRAGLQTVLAVAQRARPDPVSLWPSENTPHHSGTPLTIPAGFTAPDQQRSHVAWRYVWTHLLQESVVAVPALRALHDTNAAVVTLAAQLLAALAAPSFEHLVLHESAWQHPLSGARTNDLVFKINKILLGYFDPINVVLIVNINIRGDLTDVSA